MMTRIQRIGRALAQAFRAMDSDHRIRVTKHLYFQVPKLQLNLVSFIGGESQSIKVSIPEARFIYQSMKSAYERKERHQIEGGELTWTTDCRVQADNPERVTIDFKGPEGSMRTVLQRKDVAATLAEFESKLFSSV